MTDEQPPESTPTNPQKSPTGKKGSPTKKKNSPTIKQGAGLNKIKQDELVKWTVFVQPETRISVNKAATKARLTVTDWIDSRLRDAATTELTNKPKPPAKPEDVADLMNQLETRLATQQAEALKAQGEQMQQLAETIKSQPANLKEWLFGKPKQG